ncbi:MAG: YdjC family protein [Rariglobus sp.]|jgi:predicted glycoside hydrolase/deacetylase ChbG (UPF0249 family)|nr:YdjC family protein [Rariglobus sp.]
MGATLYLRADDAGLSSGTNAAIDAASSVCPNIGLMAVAPAIEDAADRFRGRKELCLGFHVTLNSEWPEIPWRALAPAGSVQSLLKSPGFFYSNPWQLPPGASYDPAEVEIELHAQLDRLRKLGMDIRYMDSHMGVMHSTPVLEALARSFAAREGLEYPHLMPKLQHGPYTQNTPENLARWSRLLDTETGSFIAVFHPATADGIVECLSPHEPGGVSPGMVRAAEAALLRAPEFATLLHAKDATVARFDDRA